MIRLAIFGNDRQTAGLENLATLFSQFGTYSPMLDISVETDYLKFLTSTAGIANLKARPFDKGNFQADLVLSIGGDGTFLTTAKTVGVAQTPIMGINSGHLGYLSAADIADTQSLVTDIIEGNYIVQPRTVIEISSDTPGMLPERPFALNEVAILKRDTASMITVDTILDGSPLASYRGDGLIISTPTGSTGYNLSVGGPIVAPTATDWIISPIAPHSLNMRPLVVNDSITLDISTRSRSTSYLLSIDGKATPLPIDITLRLTKAKYVVNVVHQTGHNFIDTLRRKMLWGIDGL